MFTQQIQPLRQEFDLTILAIVPNDLSGDNEERRIIGDLENSSFAKHLPAFARSTHFDQNGSPGPGLRERIAFRRAYREGKPLAQYDPENDMLERLDELATIVEQGGGSPMVDENRFAGLSEAEEAEPEPESEPEPVEDEPDEDEAEGGPAFAFDETVQESVYIREETAQQIDDAKFEVEALLRREHDIRDLAGREFQDALLRIGASDPEALVEQIVNERSD